MDTEQEMSYHSTLIFFLKGKNSQYKQTKFKKGLLKIKIYNLKPGYQIFYITGISTQKLLKFKLQNSLRK